MLTITKLYSMNDNNDNDVDNDNNDDVDNDNNDDDDEEMLTITKLYLMKCNFTHTQQDKAERGDYNDNPSNNHAFD
jgi:hypothetical protein